MQKTKTYPKIEQKSNIYSLRSYRSTSKAEEAFTTPGIKELQKNKDLDSKYTIQCLARTNAKSLQPEPDLNT